MMNLAEAKNHKKSGDNLSDETFTYIDREMEALSLQLLREPDPEARAKFQELARLRRSFLVRLPSFD